MDILNFFHGDNLYIINELKKTAQDEDIKISLVGGSIRDAILKREITDLDFSLSCDPIEIIPNLPFKDYTYNKEFKTAKVKYKGKVIDLIMERKETYTTPGVLPSVIPSNIYDDLFRRDFTINSIAYDIVNDKIIDFFSGIEDILNKKIRKIHRESYKEDGTRIFRAVKYKVRYDFNYEDMDEIRKEINSDFLSLLSNDRIVKEVLLFLKEEKWVQDFLELSRLRIMNIDESKFSEEYPFLDMNKTEDRLIKLLISVHDDRWFEILTGNNLINKKIKLSIVNYDSKEILNELNMAKTNYEIYKILCSASDYDLKFLMTDKKMIYKVINYNINLSEVTPSFSGEDLINKGYKEGKDIGKLIDNNLRIRLNTLV